MKVLIVDDSPSMRRIIARFLSQLGHNVSEAESGKAGLVLVGADDGISLALVDLTMPEMNGLEFARQAKGLRPGIQILFTSGYGEDDLLLQGMSVAGLNFIQKPFSIGPLEEAMRRALAGGPGG